MNVSTVIRSPFFEARFGGHTPGDTISMRRRRAMLRAAVIMRRAFAENFADEGRPDRWAALAPRTIREKLNLLKAGLIRARNRRGTLINRRSPQPIGLDGLKPLIRSGRMRTSLVRRGAPGNITRINAEQGSMEVGSSVPYLQYHQTGTRRMPARPVVVLTEADWQEVIEAVIEELCSVYGVSE